MPRFAAARRTFVIASLIATLTTTSQAADDVARRARVAVRVGPRTTTVGELEDRVAQIPPYQAVTYGAAREEIVKAFVEQVVVRELLLGVGAEERKLDTLLPTKQQIDRAKSSATLRALRVGLPSPNAIPAADVEGYYAANRSRFEAPERMNLWRILCKTRDEAESVIADAKKNLETARWSDLAREHSLDKATNLRGGNLGFVAPDGQSSEAGLKVDVALVKAAASARDGELLAQPVAEGTSGFAVLWRRTTVPATKRSLEDATAQIRTTLYRERTEAAEKKLIDDLRKSKVTDVDVEPLKIIEFPALDAGINLPRSIPSATPRK